MQQSPIYTHNTPGQLSSPAAILSLLSLYYFIRLFETPPLSRTKLNVTLESVYSFNRPTLWSLIGANLFVTAMAMRFHWSLLELMWVFWSQSVIIGVINFCKLLTLTNFSTEGLRINGRRVSPTQATKVSTALFFAMHYGFFHFVYMFFLFAFSAGGDGLSLGKVTSFNGIIVSALIFLANHLYSFFTNWPQEKANTNLGQQMMIPYARIVPMHLTIIFGALLGQATGFSAVPLLFFIGLKTIADIILHLYEHRRSRQ